MTNPIIKVHKLGKRYRIGAKIDPKGRDNFRDAILNTLKAPFKNFKRLRKLTNFEDENTDTAKDIIWALKDVSFEINKGEVLGIIGRNGSGKSTLLKILSRITEPTEGYAELRGRVASLLEVGTGFHRELTGRENIYLNGSILGMKKWEIDEKFDEIVAFSEIEKFIDTPVKHYSSGMYVRLAFAVAAHLEPEILLVDEVLAVGDAAFQKKCLGKMSDIAKGGRTVLFVSHNMVAVSSLCTKAVLLDCGEFKKQGSVEKVIEAYRAYIHTDFSKKVCDRIDRKGNGNLKIMDIQFVSKNSHLTNNVISGEEIEISIQYETAKKSHRNEVSISIAIYSLNGQYITMFWNVMTGDMLNGLPSTGKIICHIPKFALSPGVYIFHIYSEVNGVAADWIEDAGKLTVDFGDFFGTGKLPPQGFSGGLMNHSWSFVT